MLDMDLLRGAAQSLFAAAYADAVEEAGGSFPSGSCIEDYTPKCPEEAVVLTAYYQGRLEAAWGYPLYRIFHAMGEVKPDERISFLYYAVMGCWGHGVGLDDDWSDRLDLASDVLSNEFLGRLTVLLARPLSLDTSDMDEIASNYIIVHGIGSLKRRQPSQ